LALRSNEFTMSDSAKNEG
jgi:hypothetical protein